MSEIWKTFYFDGNDAWGKIDSRKEWERIKEAYKGTDLSVCRRCDFAKKEGRDKFGFRAECSGEDTLGEFFAENNMEM